MFPISAYLLIKIDKLDFPSEILETGKRGTWRLIMDSLVHPCSLLFVFHLHFSTDRVDSRRLKRCSGCSTDRMWVAKLGHIHHNTQNPTGSKLQSVCEPQCLSCCTCCWFLLFILHYLILSIFCLYLCIYFCILFLCLSFTSLFLYLISVFCLIWIYHLIISFIYYFLFWIYLFIYSLILFYLILSFTSLVVFLVHIPCCVALFLLSESLILNLPPVNQEEPASPSWGWETSPGMLGMTRPSCSVWVASRSVWPLCTRVYFLWNDFTSSAGRRSFHAGAARLSLQLRDHRVCLRNITTVFMLRRRVFAPSRLQSWKKKKQSRVEAKC